MIETLILALAIMAIPVYWILSPGKSPGEDARPEKPQTDYKQLAVRGVMLQHFPAIKRDRNRLAVLAYSETIQRIARGEHVPVHAAAYIAAQLDGGEAIAEEIKRVGA